MFKIVPKKIDKCTSIPKNTYDLFYVGNLLRNILSIFVTIHIFPHISNLLEL